MQRPEATVVAVAAAVAALLLVARAVAVPAAPGGSPIPSAMELRRLEAYLEPTGETARDPGPVVVRGDPFGGRPAMAPADGSGAGAEARGPRWRVSAIMIGGERRIAVLNDRLVRPGDALPGGGRVEAVERDHVLIVTADGVRRRIPLER